MTKQKFPREMESNRNGLRAMAAELTRAELELSWSRRADAQPLPLARTGPRGQTMCTCTGTKDSVDKGLREPPAPSVPVWLGVSQWV